MATVTILGAGAWGTALALTLARNGHRVTLAVRRNRQLAALGRDRENQSHLPGIHLPRAVRIAALNVESLAGADTIVLAIPSQFARATLAPLAPAVPATSTLISVSKGVEQISLCRMSEMLAELAPSAERIAVISGPGFAPEIARGKPAALVAAAYSDAVARKVQALFANRSLRLYTSPDVIGVELGGASKNVIAIAAGVSDGLALGASARAALITRGVAEMMRLAEAAGAKRETLAGLAGLGDLVLTATSDLSRNRQLGLAIGRGEGMAVPVEGAAIAEGVPNACSILRLAQRLGVVVPIVSAVYRILYEAASAEAMVDELLSRQLKAEF